MASKKVAEKTKKDVKEFEDAPPAKRKALPEPDSTDDDDDGDVSDEDADVSSNAEDEEDPQEIAINFKAIPPEKGDRNGIVALLRQTFRCFPIDVADLANVILEQPSVGCIVIPEDEEEQEETGSVHSSNSSTVDDMYAVSTIIPLAKYYNDHPSIAKLVKFLGAKCPSVVTRDIVENLSSVGLLINERLINVPASIVQHTLPSLKNDLEIATKSDPSFGKVKNLILISKSMKPLGGKEEEAMFEFANQEEEYLLKVAISSDSFKVAARDVEDCTLLGGNWNMSDSSSSEQEDNEDEKDEENGDQKNEYSSFRHILLLPVDVLSMSPNALFPGVSE